MNKSLSHADVKVGDTLPALTLPAIGRTTLALYAGASGDHNPIHIDIDFARRSRMPDVFAHGMLSAAYVARALTDWAPQRQLRSLALRFTGITHLGHRPTCSGRVTETFEAGGERRARVELRCANQYGEDKIVGEAVLALD
ncbi:MAG: MaoC family dehydratase [Proteobacteria bacterium]|nr:MaoC family dehydratase [Pseudomonadota bacterium]